MTTIYFKDTDGKKVTVEVTDEFAKVYHETRRAINRNNDKEEYWRDKKLSNLNDHDEELTAKGSNPEAMQIAAEENSERRVGMLAVLKTLTPGQLEIVKLLRKGLTVSQIARLLNKNQKTVYESYKAIAKKFEIFLR